MSGDYGSRSEVAFGDCDRGLCYRRACVSVVLISCMCKIHMGWVVAFLFSCVFVFFFFLRAVFNPVFVKVFPTGNIFVVMFLSNAHTQKGVRRHSQNTIFTKGCLLCRQAGLAQLHAERMPSFSR